MDIDVKPKVYSFPHKTKALATRADLNGVIVGVSTGVLVAGGLITFWLLNLQSSNSLLVNIILSVLMIALSLGMGFVAMILGAGLTYTIQSSKTFFLKQKLGQQVKENFTNFIEWMRFNFNVDVSNLEVKNGNDRGAEWLVNQFGSRTFVFKDMEGNSFSMSLVEGEENEYLVTFVETTSDAPVEETPEEKLAEKTSVENSPFIEFFKAYKDSLNSDTQQVVTKVISMVNALDESTLDAETSETVRLAKAELDTLSILMLRTVPFGIDEDVEKEFLAGVRVLDKTLTSVYDAYKAELKNKLSSRVKEVEFFFQT